MSTDQKNNSVSGMVLLLFVTANVVILEHAFTVNEHWYAALIITFPALIVTAVLHKRAGDKRWKVES